MAESADDAHGAGRMRVVGLAFGVCLAGIATAALVVTENPKVLRLAVLGALWAFVLAAVGTFARRRSSVPPPAEPDGRAEVAQLRQVYERELEREVAARREYELQLEVFLRRELETGLKEDVGALREEMQRWHGDVIQRLDGELRLERIETNRLLGMARPSPDAAAAGHPDGPVPGPAVHPNGAVGPARGNGASRNGSSAPDEWAQAWTEEPGWAHPVPDGPGGGLTSGIFSTNGTAAGSVPGAERHWNGFAADPFMPAPKPGNGHADVILPAGRLVDALRAQQAAHFGVQ